ncbi:hypothetical protein PMAYCL1PPCAC_21490, partial [Pristionchus mayeri]
EYFQNNVTVVSNKIYFRTAFIVNMIRGRVGLRLTSLKECGNKRTTKVRVGDLTFPLSQTTVYTVCPWHFAPHCRLVGHFHSATITKNSQQKVPLPEVLPKFAEIYDDRNVLSPSRAVVYPLAPGLGKLNSPLASLPSLSSSFWIRFASSSL